MTTIVDAVFDRIHWSLNRYYSWRLRRVKAASTRGWLFRWNRACGRCWAILSAGPASQARFERFGRNHHRLMRLIRAKQETLDRGKRRGGRIQLRKERNPEPFTCPTFKTPTQNP
jgi:hypothetical protein